MLKLLSLRPHFVGLDKLLLMVLSTCPTNWGMRPVDSLKWVDENMIPYYPLGVKKDFE